MIIKILKMTFYSAILFCTTSFFSFLFSLISNILNHTLPKLHIGFPFNFYYQFNVANNCNGFELLHETNLKNFILNYIICLLLIVILNKSRLLNIKQNQ
jgi:hypothetical protein